MNTAEIISKLGGTRKAAELCDVTPGAVSQWRTNGIPKAQLRYIRLARPEIFQSPEHILLSGSAKASAVSSF